MGERDHATLPRRQRRSLRKGQKANTAGLSTAAKAASIKRYCTTVCQRLPADRKTAINARIAPVFSTEARKTTTISGNGVVDPEPLRGQVHQGEHQRHAEGVQSYYTARKRILQVAQHERPPGAGNRVLMQPEVHADDQQQVRSGSADRGERQQRGLQQQGRDHDGRQQHRRPHSRHLFIDAALLASGPDHETAALGRTEFSSKAAR